MYNRMQRDLGIFWLMLSCCVNGVYFGGKYGFPGLVDRVDAAILGLLIGALAALIFYGHICLVVYSPRRKIHAQNPNAE